MKPTEIVIAVVSFASSIAVLRVALLDRGSFWAGPVFGFAALTGVAAFATHAPPIAMALSAMSVLAVVMAWAMRIGAPRTLAHFADAPRHRDGTPGWWPGFERDLRRYATERG